MTITDEEFRSLSDDCDAILLGALGDPRVPDNTHARDILLGLRFRLDLYVNFRPYEVAIQEDLNTRPGVEHIIRAAFEHAVSNGRDRVTMVDKANAMPMAGSL